MSLISSDQTYFKSSLFSKDFYSCIVCVVVVGGGGRLTGHDLHMEVGRQLAGVASLLPPCGSRGLIKLTGGARIH